MRECIKRLAPAFWICLSAIGVLAAQSVDSPNPSNSNTDQSVIQELKDRVARLEIRVENLQNQLDELKRVKFPPNLTLPEPSREGRPKLPPGSVPFEFNGNTYYLIPVLLDMSPSPVKAPDLQKPE